MGRYVVVDLEMCRIPRAKRTKEYDYGSEIIQIGAVLLDERFDVADEFATYVRPEYGFIDNYISRLTGISSWDVKDAPTLREAMEDFLRWFPQDARMTAWSTTDEKQLRKECGYKGILTERLGEILDESIDCQEMFDEKIGLGRPYKLEEAFYVTDICPEGRLHDGLADARNTAKLFRKMMTETVFRFNEAYVRAQSDEIVHLGSSLADILLGLNIGLSA